MSIVLLYEYFFIQFAVLSSVESQCNPVAFFNICSFAYVDLGEKLDMFNLLQNAPTIAQTLVHTENVLFTLSNTCLCKHL